MVCMMTALNASNLFVIGLGVRSLIEAWFICIQKMQLGVVLRVGTHHPKISYVLDIQDPMALTSSCYYIWLRKQGWKWIAWIGKMLFHFIPNIV